jgi:type 2 lantibiotic biosynthesis protein LanM
MSARVARYRRAGALTTDSAWEAKCVALGFSSAQVEVAIASETPPDAPSPADEWITALERSFMAAGDEATPARPAGAAGFLALVEPIMQESTAQLQRRVAQIAAASRDLPFNPATVVALFVEGLTLTMRAIVGRTLILELNVARLRGELAGDTPEERFASYTETLRDPGRARALFDEYPVMARLLAESAHRWVEFVAEVLQHMCTDWAALKAWCGVPYELGVLSAVEMGAGDVHHGGRSVVIATFTSGWRVVYKPRVLDVDERFNHLLGRLNDAGQDPPLRSPRLLARAEHGWAEFIPTADCDTEQALRRFYQRIGAFTAILRVLEATDFHLENLIASGEHPILIDLEALFHPRPAVAEPQRNGQALGWDVIGKSVLRVGLLPARAFATDVSEGIELSGLGGAPGQLSPTDQLAIDEAGKDTMHVVRRQVPLPGSKNRPRLNGVEVDPALYASDIIDGFTGAYRLLMSATQEFREETLGAFATAPVRAILRPTRLYGLLLQEATHPDAMRDALHRERLFDWLWSSYDREPHLRRLIGAEQSDLLANDVPIFSSLPGSRDVWTSEGERISEVWREASLEAVRRNWSELSEDDLALQKWFIYASLSALNVGDASIAAWSHMRSSDRHQEAAHNDARAMPAPRDGLALEARAMEAACDIGDYLGRKALRDGKAIGWLGLQMRNERAWNVEPVGNDLYSGLPGIALFYSHLALTSGRGDFAEIAQDTAAQLSRDCRRALEEEQSQTPAAIGLFVGKGGLMYSLSHLAALWADDALAHLALEHVPSAHRAIPKDTALDVIGGSAGLIMGLASLYAVTGEHTILDVMSDAAQHILARARRMDVGIAWETSIEATRPLAGLSHGAAGFAQALGLAGHLTGESHFLQGARDALAYEAAAFNQETDNWPDYRVLPPVPSETLRGASIRAWCHGAPGIGIARARLITLGLNDANCLADCKRAIDSTLRQGFGGSDCLCHGDIGNLEVLLSAPPQLQSVDLTAAARAQVASLLDRASSRGWQCGVPHAVSTPGLMTGLAGVGYGLLRFAQYPGIPSVLAAEPPRVAVGKTTSAA